MGNIPLLLEEKIDLFSYVKMIIVRYNINRRFNNNRISMIELLSEISSILFNENDNQWIEIEYIYNTIGFWFFTILDMMTYIEMMIFERNKIKQVPIMHSIYKNLEESINNMLDHTDKKFNDYLVEIDISKEMLNELEIYKNDLIEFIEKHKDDIRNSKININDSESREFRKYFSKYFNHNYLIAVEVIMQLNDKLIIIGGFMQRLMEYTSNYINEKYS